MTDSYSHPFRPTERVPDGRIGAAAPLADGAHGAIKASGVEAERSSDNLPGGFDHADGIANKSRELTGPGTGAKKDPMIPARFCTSLAEERYQTPAHKRIATQVPVGAHIDIPEFRETRGFRPQTHDLMIIVGQDNPAARADGADHLPDDLFR